MDLLATTAAAARIECMRATGTVPRGTEAEMCRGLSITVAAAARPTRATDTCAVTCGSRVGATMTGRSPGRTGRGRRAMTKTRQGQRGSPTALGGVKAGEMRWAPEERCLAARVRSGTVATGTEGLEGPPGGAAQRHAAVMQMPEVAAGARVVPSGGPAGMHARCRNTAGKGTRWEQGWFGACGVGSAAGRR